MPLSQKLSEEENWVTGRWIPRGNVDCVNRISAAKEVRLKTFETGVTEPPTWWTSLELRNQVVLKCRGWTWEQYCLLLIHGSLLQSQPIQILHQGKQTMRTGKGSHHHLTNHQAKPDGPKVKEQEAWGPKISQVQSLNELYLGNSQSSQSDLLFTTMWIKLKMHLCRYQSGNRNINILNVTYKQDILTRIIYKKRKAYITWVTSSDKIYMFNSSLSLESLTSAQKSAKEE